MLGKVYPQLINLIKAKLDPCLSEIKNSCGNLLESIICCDTIVLKKWQLLLSISITLYTNYFPRFVCGLIKMSASHLALNLCIRMQKGMMLI